MSSSSELISLSARRAVELLHAGGLRPGELVEAAIARIEATDGALNALPVRCFDRAREQARRIESGEAPRGVLGGLPIVVKDNNDVGGVGTSGGTPIFKDRVPAVSDRTIARLEAQGAIPLAKSNLSELGGANTTNALFGATRNPWNPALTCGGSSGGSSVAVATGQVWLAHGNDVGGSLRVPPAFCGVVGLRPTPGRVVRKALCEPFDTVMVDGPIARDVADLALMFDAMVGFDARDPLSAPSPEGPFLPAALAPCRPAGRVAWAATPGGVPVDRRILAACEAALQRLARSGLHVEAAEPECSQALPAILALRGQGYASNWGPMYRRHPERFTADVRGDIERGLQQDAETLRDAMRYRTALSQRVSTFFESFDVLLCPATQALPFPVEMPWPREVDGKPFTTYVDWLGVNYIWSLTGCPVLALPVGIEPGTGLPVAIQLMGPPRSEAMLLALGAWIEAELGLAEALALPRLAGGGGAGR